MRRNFLWRLLGVPTLGIAAPAGAASKSKVLIKSAWGSADPTIFVGLVQWADKVLTE